MREGGEKKNNLALTFFLWTGRNRASLGLDNVGCWPVTKIHDEHSHGRIQRPSVIFNNVQDPWTADTNLCNALSSLSRPAYRASKKKNTVDLQIFLISSLELYLPCTKFLRHWIFECRRALDQLPESNWNQLSIAVARTRFICKTPEAGTFFTSEMVVLT